MYVISAIKFFYKKQENVIQLMENEREWQVKYLLELKEK